MIKTVYEPCYRPQILLLGNGINRCFGFDSWDDLLQLITTNPNLPKGVKLHSPMPLQAILATGDNVKSAMDQFGKKLYENPLNSAHTDMLTTLLNINFDDILTTNYSYELEQASVGGERLSDYRLKTMTDHTGKVKNAEPQYMLHTFNKVNHGKEKTRIWHIHGEARKPNSMILGHYYYANMLFRMQNELKQRENQYHTYQKFKKALHFESWLDAFILGDVYVLGFSYEHSEFDLWWLLNRKKREIADCGKLYFYEPVSCDSYSERLGLLEVMGAEIRTCGMTNNQSDSFYHDFYHQAIAEIKRSVEQSRKN